MSMYRQSIHLLRRCLLQNVSAGLNKTGVRYHKRWVAPTLRELQRRRDKEGPEAESPRSSFLEWNYDAELFAFGKRLGEEFESEVLRTALIHRSYVVQEEMKASEAGIETKTTAKDNKELVKIGEEIIAHCISVAYQKDYPDVVIKSIKNYLTTDAMLSHVAKHIGLKDIVLCSDFPVEERTLAKSFNAIVGAVEASSGSERAERFVKDFLLVQLHDKDLFELWNPENPSQHLQSLLKEHNMPAVEPRLCNQSATNTILANFQVGLYCEKKLIGIGWGESLEIAQETASFDAIKNIYTKRT